MNFQKDDIVEWTSHAGSHLKTKRGKIVLILDAQARFFAVQATLHKLVVDLGAKPMFDNFGPDGRKPYLVLVPGVTPRSKPRLYRPVTSQLKKVNV